MILENNSMSDEMNQQPVEPVAQPEVQSPPSLLDMIQDDSLKQEQSLASFKDVTNLAKSYVNLSKMMGNSLRVPGPDASEEARNEFYKKVTSSVNDLIRLPDKGDKEAMANLYSRLGRPESPDNYDIRLPEDVPQELVNQDMLKGFKNYAYELGLNSDQVQKLIEFDTQRQMQMYDHLAVEKEQGAAILKKMWGNDFDNRSQAAQKMIELYGQKYPEAAKQLLNKHVTDPLVYQMLAELGQMYQERGHIQSKSMQFGLTPDEARARIQEIRSNGRHALHNPSDPNHEAAMEQMSKLYAAAYPNQDNQYS